MHEDLNNDRNQYQNPPTLTEEQAQAVVDARTAIASLRNPEGGDGQTYQEVLLGVTADGTFVSVERAVGDWAEESVVRTGNLASMVVGAEPAVHELEYGLEFRGPGRGMLKFDEQTISIPPSNGSGSGEFPTLDGKPIFDVNEDGYPWMTAPRKPVAEQAESEAKPAINAAPEQVAKGGLRNFFRRK